MSSSTLIGPYAGECFLNRTTFRARLREIVAYKDRIEGRKPYVFVSPLLGEALLDRHFRFRSIKGPLTNFGFIKNKQLFQPPVGDVKRLEEWEKDEHRSLSVLIGTQYCQFSYYDIITPIYKFSRKLFDLKCRRRFQKFRVKWKEIHGTDRCKSCGRKGKLDLDHIFPSHAQIRDVCWKALNDWYPQQREKWWEEYQSLEYGKQATKNGWPDEHPLAFLYDVLTHRTQYQLLCKSCHYVEGRRRRGKELEMDKWDFRTAVAILLGEVKVSAVGELINMKEKD